MLEILPVLACSAGGNKRSSKPIDTAAALVLGRDPEKASSVETAFALITALASHPGSGRAAAAAFHDAGALTVRLCSERGRTDRCLPYDVH